MILGLPTDSNIYALRYTMIKAGTPTGTNVIDEVIGSQKMSDLMGQHGTINVDIFYYENVVVDS